MASRTPRSRPCPRAARRSSRTTTATSRGFSPPSPSSPTCRCWRWAARSSARRRSPGASATGGLVQAFVAAIAGEAIDEQLRKAVEKGKVVAAPGADIGALAMSQGLITADEYAQWQKKETLRKSVIKVDDFPQDFGRAQLV